MQDANTDQPEPQFMPPRASRRSGRVTLAVALLAFALGVALAVWLVWRGDLDFAWSRSQTGEPQGLATAQTALAPPQTAKNAAQMSLTVGGVETRLALMEERLSRLDLQASAASGNAARAEGLLIAFAARRILAKGGQLGFLEDQLKLRFGGAQPEAVQTIAAFAKSPITLDQLAGGLDALAPVLAEASHGNSGWTKWRRELSNLFVVRRASTPSVDPRDRVQRARLMLTSGKVREAIAEVERMPGADDAQAWIDGATRYDRAQQALDVIETAAMLEPRHLHDAEGKAVDQPSPLGQPTPPASPATAFE